jgi:hypothetical protein
MSKKDFDAFLKKQESKEREENNWDEIKREWLNEVIKFFSLVQKWLNEYEKQGQAKLEFFPYQLNEEYIGSYQTQKLHLKIANQEIVFIPIGTRLFGSKGRIDMEGRAGKVKFLLVNKNATRAGVKVKIYDGKKPKNLDWVWKIATPPPTIQLIELNEESFFDALMEVING